MSPERIREEPYGSDADMWAVGCILYEIATGHKLFRREMDVTKGRRRSLTDKADADLQELVDGLQAVNSAEDARFAALAELATSLEVGDAPPPQPPRR